MNFKTLFFIFFFGLIGCTATSFAQDIIPKDLDVYQGTVLPIQIESPVGAPQLKSYPVAGNLLELVSTSGTTYFFNYTPDPAYLGPDGFSIEVIEQVFPPLKTTYVFQIDVITSMIDANDDFIHLNSLDEITIDPLANDESSSSTLTVSLAHVLRGTAVVNADQSISYTPVDEDPDYIIYSVSDEYNTTSSSTVYLSQESTLDDALTVREYVLASGAEEYFVLPNSEYTLIEESHEFGEVEQINDFVFKYIANTNTSGNDVVRFLDSNSNEYQADVEVIEKYTDEGYVKDDLFYTASNTHFLFDVTENDVVDQYVISDYSDDDQLIHMGSGMFSYTPNPYFSGVKTFYYTADDGITEETGTIEIVVNNFKPTNYFDYNLSTPQNQPRIIEYDVPIGTEYFEIASLPTHGSVEIFTEDESVDVGCEEGIQNVFAIYTPDEDYVGLDVLTIKYCASDNNICTNVNIEFEVVSTVVDDCICIDDCVWPGDTNGDGKVSVVDALSIARFIGNGGAPRVSSAYGEIYEGSSGTNWAENQVNGKNIKHIDADGDGLITASDLEVVVDNYGEINSVISSDVLGIKNIPFLLTTEQTEVDSGEVLFIDVVLGTETFPGIDIEGVAFAVNLPASLVDSSSVKVEYLESGYLVKNAPYISLTHQPSDGIIHTAGAKTNSKGATGSGIVATISFIVEENAEGFKDDDKRSTSKKVGDIIATLEVTDIVIEDSRGFKYALPNSSLDITVKSGNEVQNRIDNIAVAPNPAFDFVTVSTKDGTPINTISIYSIEGKLMKQIDDVKASERSINIGDFEGGLYIIETSANSDSFINKLIIK